MSLGKASRGFWGGGASGPSFEVEDTGPVIQRGRPGIPRTRLGHKLPNVNLGGRSD